MLKQNAEAHLQLGIAEDDLGDEKLGNQVGNIRSERTDQIVVIIEACILS